MLVSRRLQTLLQLIEEYGLAVDITLVRSEQNKADELTKVSQKWFKTMKQVNARYWTSISIAGTLG